MKTRSKVLRAHAAVLLTVLIWGGSWVLVKLALHEVQPTALAFLRYLSASVGFAIFLFLHRQNLPIIHRRDWASTLAAALTGVVGYGVLAVTGLQGTSASVGSLLNSAGPAFTLALSCIFLSERLTRYKVIGIGVSLCGVILVVLRGSGNADLTVASISGPLIVTAAMLSWAIYSIVMKPLLRVYPSTIFTSYTVILGAVLMMPLALVIDWGSLANASPIVWSAVIYVGIGGTLIGQFLWNYGLSILDTSQVSVYLYLMPVVTVITAIVFIQEVITVYFLLGGTMIILGIVLTSWARSDIGKAESPSGDSKMASPKSVKTPSTAKP